MITNPILPGFNPDPSICRVGGDYYIATSTFEWYPGVQIHHSTDLVNWRLISRPLRRKSQLDMRGNPDSCGVWAPCLSHADGPVWLRVLVRGAAQQFYWKQAGDWVPLGPNLQASVISDEGGVGEHGSFTGAFVGMVAFDITGQGKPADFASFCYSAA